MSNVNNQFKELINEAIHNYFHDKTETEMILKDWLYGICEQADEYEAKAKLADDIITAWKTGDFDFTEGEGSLPDHGIAPVPNYHMFDFGQYVDSLLDEYESGERNES